MFYSQYNENKIIYKSLYIIISTCAFAQVSFKVKFSRCRTSDKIIMHIFNTFTLITLKLCFTGKKNTVIQQFSLLYLSLCVICRY